MKKLEMTKEEKTVFDILIRLGDSEKVATQEIEKRRMKEDNKEYYQNAYCF